MNYPLWCTTCDALTGHEIHLRKSTCMKCHGERATPIGKWIVGIVALTGITAFLLYIIVQSVSAILDILI